MRGSSGRLGVHLGSLLEFFVIFAFVCVSINLPAFTSPRPRAPDGPNPVISDGSAESLDMMNGEQPQLGPFAKARSMSADPQLAGEKGPAARTKRLFSRLYNQRWVRGESACVCTHGVIV